MGNGQKNTISRDRSSFVLVCMDLSSWGPVCSALLFLWTAQWNVCKKSLLHSTRFLSGLSDLCTVYSVPQNIHGLKFSPGNRPWILAWQHFTCAWLVIKPRQSFHCSVNWHHSLINESSGHSSAVVRQNHYTDQEARDKTGKHKALFPRTSAEHMAVPWKSEWAIGVQSLCISGTDYSSWGARD